MAVGSRNGGNGGYEMLDVYFRFILLRISWNMPVEWNASGSIVSIEFDSGLLIKYNIPRPE